MQKNQDIAKEPTLYEHWLFILEYFQSLRNSILDTLQKDCFFSAYQPCQKLRGFLGFAFKVLHHLDSKKLPYFSTTT